MSREEEIERALREEERGLTTGFDLIVETIGAKRADRFLCEIALVLTVAEQEGVHAHGAEAATALRAVHELSERLRLQPYTPADELGTDKPLFASTACKECGVQLDVNASFQICNGCAFDGRSTSADGVKPKQAPFNGACDCWSAPCKPSCARFTKTADGVEVSTPWKGCRCMDHQAWREPDCQLPRNTTDGGT